MGIIAAVGESVTDLKVGTPAALMTFGSYTEFTVVLSPEQNCFNVWQLARLASLSTS